MTALARPATNVNDRSIFSSGGMLHKDYNRKSSVEENIIGRESQGTCRQDEPMGGKPPVVM
jgi:hypothetical protein